MSLPLLIHGIGSIGVFATRAFLPAFATACLLRFGPGVPWLEGLGLLEHVRGVPSWFTSDAALIALGVLSILELVAERVPELRGLSDATRDAMKVGMAALTFAGVLSTTDLAVASGIAGGPIGLPGLLACLGVGAGTFVTAGARRAVVAPLRELDEDDDLGLQGPLAWVEDLWAGLGPVALVLLPIAAVAALGIAALLYLGLRRRIEARAEAARLTCPSCGRAVHAAATRCPHCGSPIDTPLAIDAIGRVLDRPADPSTHPLRLATVRRCPACASRLDRLAVDRPCPGCGLVAMADPKFVGRYVRFVDRRVPAVLAGCALLGLIPVLGVIPGVILYRVMIVAPYRRYLPPGRGYLLRWAVRIAVLILVAFQWVPVAGGLALPAMAMLNYGAYRGAFRRLTTT